MSEHAWAQDNLAAHVAGGLDAGERERLERHLAECLDCTGALEHARAADGRLLALFKGIRPGPALEDRLIRSLRQGAARKRVLPGLPGPWVKVVLATAAVAMLAVVGAGISTFIEKDGLFAMAPPEAADGTLDADRSATTYFRRNTLRANGAMLPKNEGIELGGVKSGLTPSGTLTPEYDSPSQGLSPEQLAQQLRAESPLALASPFALADGRERERIAGLKHDKNKVNSPGLKSDDAVKAMVAGTSAPSNGGMMGMGGGMGMGGVSVNGSATTPTSQPPNMPPAQTQAPPYGIYNAPVSPLNLTTGSPPLPATGLNANQVVSNGYFNDRTSSSSGSTTGSPNTFDGIKPADDGTKGEERQAWSGRSPGRDKDVKDLKESPAEKKLPGLEYYFRPDSTFSDLNRESKTVENTKITAGGDANLDKELRRFMDERKDKKGLTEGEKLPLQITTPGGKETGDKGSAEAGKTDPNKPPAKTAPPKAPEAPEPMVQKIIIRSGDIEFVIDSFDNGVLIIQKLIAATKGGYVATINSDKLPNGKVFGSVVVRVPPEQLDKLVLDLRQQLGKIGELKGQRIGSRDITKEFTDLQSRLKAARTMEERLLNIIKSEKGQIKDLLMAEKELGVWRTKIEELTGELNYYSNLASYSTLTISLSEKELRVAASVSESERVQAGVEVEDVEKAMRELLKAVDEAKGRVTRSELKQQSAGQYSALLQFEVAPEGAGPVRDRLKQLGNVTRLDVDRVQEAENGDKLPMDGKLHRGNTKFFVSLYNLFSIAPRETVSVRVYVTDVAAAYRELREKVIEAKGRILDANLSEQDRKNVIAHLDFNVKRVNEGAIQTALAAAGELLGRLSARAPAGANVTDTKVLYRVDLIANVPAREIVTMRLAAPDVAAAYAALRKAVAEAKGRVSNTNFNEQDKTNVGAQIDFDVKRADQTAIQTALETAGEVLTRTVVRAAEGDNVTDSKVHFSINLAGNVQPRDIVTVRLAALDVPVAYAALREVVAKAKGRVVNANFDEKDPKNAGATLEFDVRRSEEAAIQLALSSAGEVLSRTVARLPEGNNVTDTKVFFKVVFPADVQPRETVTITIAATDVAAAHRALRKVVVQAKARIISANLEEKDRQNVDGQLDFDVRRTEEGAVQTALGEAGAVLSRFVSRITSGDNYTDARVLFKVKLVPANNIEPREVSALTVEVADVEREMSILTAQVKEVQGRVVKGPTAAQERSGRVTARVVYDVPLVMASTIVDKAKGAGTVRISETAPNPQAPEGKLAIARIVVTFENAEVLVPRDDGLSVQVRSGLSSSLQGLFWSVKFLIIGLLFVLPWLLIIWAMYWVGRRMWRPAGVVATEAPAK